LLVDGTDRVLCHKAEFAFRPTVRQTASLNGLLAACCEVFNAGLQERREAWQHSGTRVGLFDQFNQIRHLRGVRDDTLAWGIQPLRGALRRLDEADSRVLPALRQRADPRPSPVPVLAPVRHGVLGDVVEGRP
jgi:putative transposase